MRPLKLIPIATLIVAICIPCHAQFTAQNRDFRISAASPDVARWTLERCTAYRSQLGTQWFGVDLSRIPEPEPAAITIVIRGHGVDGGTGGGSTSLFCSGGRYLGSAGRWEAPNYERLDSVIAHEVFHIVSANVLRSTSPRWLEEGTAQACESTRNRNEFRARLVDVLKFGRGIPFNQFVSMREYPNDITAFYSQGSSVTNFLLEHGGRRRLGTFLRAIHANGGTGVGPATKAIRQVYGYQDLSEFQLAWVDWIRQGFPEHRARIGRGPVVRFITGQGWQACDSGQCEQFVSLQPRPIQAPSAGQTPGIPPVGPIPPDEPSPPLVQPAPATQPLNIRAGEVDTLDPGTPASARVRRDADGAYVIDFGIPRGADGNDGRDGRDGQDGQDGPAVSIDVEAIKSEIAADVLRQLEPRIPASFQIRPRN